MSLESDVLNTIENYGKEKRKQGREEIIGSIERLIFALQQQKIEHKDIQYTVDIFKERIKKGK